MPEVTHVDPELAALVRERLDARQPHLPPRFVPPTGRPRTRWLVAAVVAAFLAGFGVAMLIRPDVGTAVMSGLLGRPPATAPAPVPPSTAPGGIAPGTGPAVRPAPSTSGSPSPTPDAGPTAPGAGGAPGPGGLPVPTPTPPGGITIQVSLPPLPLPTPSPSPTCPLALPLCLRVG